MKPPSPEPPEHSTGAGSSVSLPDDPAAGNEEVASSYTLLDGANSAAQRPGLELAAQMRIAADRNRAAGERLEAYENIFESEVGDTVLTRARNIEREINLRQIYLKFEGDNPSGTQKDRIAFAQAMDALRRGFDAITVATCGNYGVAVALAASMAGLRCLIYIPSTYHTQRVKEIEQYGAQVHRVSGDYEAVVHHSRAVAQRDEIYDANPGGANTPLQLMAYREIAYEIYDELRDAPAAVAVPVSNGTTLAGIYKGFLSLFRRGKTSRVPRMIAGSSFGKNPIVQAFLKQSPRCEDLVPDKIRETSVNEALINWSSIDGDHALDAIRASGGWATFVSDKNMTRFARLIRDQQGISALPASAVGLVSLLERHRREVLPGDRYVVVLTGRRT